MTRSANTRGYYSGVLYPVAALSTRLAFNGTAADIKTGMLDEELYLFTCTETCYIRQDGTDASAGDGSMMVTKYCSVKICGLQGGALSVIQESIAGVATLQLMRHM